MLKINISSFSYKRGLPAGSDKHGGGFIFDCRCVPNPGRDPANKLLSGKDKAVKEQLQNEKSAKIFKAHTLSLLELAVQNYLKRDFSELQICFGCTGGQHRSVFFAEAAAAELKKHSGVSIELTHRDLKLALEEAAKK